MALALISAERQETATALALSEQKFRAIYDRAFEFIGLLDPDGKLQDANQRALDFAGVTLSEIAGRPFCEGPWWERCEGSREKVKAAIDKGRQGHFSRFEAIHVNRRGERIIVDFSLTPIFDASGKVVSLQPEGRDITEIKRSEAALRASEASNRSTLQALPAHIAVVDGEGRVIAVNQAWTEFAAACGGQNAGVGDSYLETCRRAAAVDADAALALTGIEAVLTGSSPQFAKEYPCHGPKERHWFLMTVVPLGLCNGGGAVIAHSDITARKLAEEVLARSKEKLEVQVAERTYQLEATLDAAVSAILTIDVSGTIQSVNAATVKLLGYSRNELLGQNVRILMPQPFNAEHDGYLKSYRETGTKKILGVGREVMARHKDGSTIPVHLAFERVFSRGPTILHRHHHRFNRTQSC